MKCFSLVARSLCLFLSFCGGAQANKSRDLAVAQEKSEPKSGFTGRLTDKKRNVNLFAVPTEKIDKSDLYFGTAISDPYRWLEDGKNQKVKDWDELQNNRTSIYLKSLPRLVDIKKKAESFLAIGSLDLPVVAGTRSRSLLNQDGEGPFYFHIKREGMKNQPTLYVREKLNGIDRSLLDVSALSSDGTTALDWYYPSHIGKWVAWGRSENGDERSTLYVRSVKTGKDEAVDVIAHTRHTSVAWLADDSGFFYTRYPDPKTVSSGEENYHCKVFFHFLGQDPHSDQEIFSPDDKTHIPSLFIDPEGKHLVIHVHRSWGANDLYEMPVSVVGRDKKRKISPIFVGKNAIYEPLFSMGELFVRTNENAPNYKLTHAKYKDISDPSKYDEVLKSHDEDTLAEVAMGQKQIYAVYTHMASSRVVALDRDLLKKGENSLTSIELPTLGSASLSSSDDGRDVFLSFTSYASPTTLYHISDLFDPTQTDSSKRKNSPHKVFLEHPWDKLEVVDTSSFQVERKWAVSKDGTKVPMFVVSKKGHIKTGPVPTILYGYGGFNVSLSPRFSPMALTAISEGAIWVTAILRGGSEFGETWHQAGMLHRKQNVFDDFYACAEALIADGITDRHHLAALGGSNGGLLVAVALTQRPDLFRAAVSSVPLTDMLRYHHFSIAKLWIPEYGSAENKEQFESLFSYSPYHHVKPGVQYPSVMFTTAESDSRVDPMHARKMVARLQEVQTDDQRPILLRMESKAGHGAGKPVSKVASELADKLGFLFNELGEE